MISRIRATFAAETAPLGLVALTGRASHMDLSDARCPGHFTQHLVVDSTAGDDGEAAPGACLVRTEACTARRRRALASAREDAVDSSDGDESIDGSERVIELVECPVECDADVGGGLEHIREVIDLGLARAGESDHKSINADGGEGRSRLSQRYQLVRVS